MCVGADEGRTCEHSGSITGLQLQEDEAGSTIQYEPGKGVHGTEEIRTV